MTGPGSQVQFYDDPATAWRVALVRVYRPGYAHPWRLHVVCERGEILGIPAKMQMNAEREFFPSTWLQELARSWGRRVMVAQSEHAYFSSDSIALRCTWRFGQNIVRPERIGKFTIAWPDQA